MKRLNHSIITLIFLGIVLLCSVTGCKEEDVNDPPLASFIITPEEGSLLTTFTFDATGCSDPEDQASTLQVRWDWNGDGLFDTDFSTNKILNHNYTETGIKQIILEVKDSKELSASTVKTLDVGLGPVPTVNTSPLKDTTAHSAICGGEVTDIGGTPVSARGVCWSTVSPPTISDLHTDDGPGAETFTSNITGLNSNTTYYVRSYATNSAGTAYGPELMFSTFYEWACGDVISVTHETGDVAPENLTTSYTTVGNITGEPTKCWITKNLGAADEADEVDDISVTAAGWYWQFNKKQGYKHDGITRTPNTTWMDPVSENSDWKVINDPCALELENGWRIPTTSEWYNILEENGWSDWSLPWSSPLKLHAAGTLKYSDGSIDRRGIIGYFWCSSEVDDENARSFGFSSDFSQIWINAKSHGFNLRCVRE